MHDIIFLAVSVTVVSILMVAAFSLTGYGRSLLSAGRGYTDGVASQVEEYRVGFYHDNNVNGTAVIDAIQSNWKSGAGFDVFVSMKYGPGPHVGSNTLYDYDKSTHDILFTPNSRADHICSQISSDANGDRSIFKITSDGVNFFNDNNIVLCDRSYAAGHEPSYSRCTGYDSRIRSSDYQFIPKNATFKGNVIRDRNGNIVLVMFVQQ